MIFADAHLPSSDSGLPSLAEVLFREKPNQAEFKAYKTSQNSQLKLKIYKKFNHKTKIQNFIPLPNALNKIPLPR